MVNVPQRVAGLHCNFLETHRTTIGSAQFRLDARIRKKMKSNEPGSSGASVSRMLGFASEAVARAVRARNSLRSSVLPITNKKQTNFFPR
jgi:hypothetical protein